MPDPRWARFCPKQAGYCMSETVCNVHLLMGREPGQSLALARPSLQAGDWLVFTETLPEASRLDSLSADVVVRQCQDDECDAPEYLSDDALAAILCRAQRIRSWW